MVNHEIGFGTRVLNLPRWDGCVPLLLVGDDMTEKPGEPKPQSLLYEVCVACGGRGCLVCKVLGVMVTGVSLEQVHYMAKLDTLRQESGISAAMLRDGRVRAMVDAFREPNASAWIQAAAEEIHDSLDGIEGESGDAAQREQDMDAGFHVWRERVMAIIRKHFIGNREIKNAT